MRFKVLTEVSNCQCCDIVGCETLYSVTWHQISDELASFNTVDARVVTVHLSRLDWTAQGDIPEDPNFHSLFTF
jgi:hypothetical protein